MNRIEIYWGKDADFEEATKELQDVYSLGEIINQLNSNELKIKGISPNDESPIIIENLLARTDDYGGVREWAILGFTNNVLRNPKIEVNTLWLCNPPTKIYQDIFKNYSKDVINEHHTGYPKVTVNQIQELYNGFDNAVIGQHNVIQKILSSIYALTYRERKKPITLLFLGDSGIGKTETAKYISSCLGADMVRIQFSMQQTNDAFQYIFGADHGKNSLARELIRRNSNVILLDEFDKVPPAFYNAFYQMFDEGIFVDANYSVDVFDCIIICTTNYKSEEEAVKNLGEPIYSRFSKVITFDPIKVDDKIKIAKRCYDKVIKEISKEDYALIEDNPILTTFEEAIKSGLYPNMRMLKNDIEDAINYEILMARHIL